MFYKVFLSAFYHNFCLDQYTVLMAACTARAEEEQILKCVELLLSRNANPNAVCR